MYEGSIVSMPSPILLHIYPFDTNHLILCWQPTAVLTGTSLMTDEVEHFFSLAQF